MDHALADLNPLDYFRSVQVYLLKTRNTSHQRQYITDTRVFGNVYCIISIAILHSGALINVMSINRTLHIVSCVSTLYGPPTGGAYIVSSGLLSYKVC